MRIARAVCLVYGAALRFLHPFVSTDRLIVTNLAHLHATAHGIGLATNF